ncbi:MAG: GNAT family N-acetyltransferase [bacterium]|nr:GNAT family N-acetyltransferase [bacterium]
MGATILGAVSRTNEAYVQQVARADLLEWGTAYSSAEFAGLPESNQLCAFTVANDDEVRRAYPEVEAHFAARGTKCLRWSAAPDRPSESMGQFLFEKGYQRRRALACGLADWPVLSARPEVKVLPARATRALYEQTFFNPAATCTSEHMALAAAAGLERLDDARYDASVALLDGKPVGRGALLHHGDIGRVIDLYVSVEHRRRGIGTAILLHLLSIARRTMARTICLEVDADDPPARRWVERAGFVADGETVQYWHPDTVAPEQTHG